MTAEQESANSGTEEDAYAPSLGHEANGYDEPSGLNEDLLERGSFANRIYEQVKNTPVGWSVRIGVHGEWGMGKTTILNYLESLAGHDGAVIVRFAPWSAQTRSELWLEFLCTFIVGILHAGIVPDLPFRFGSLWALAGRFWKKRQTGSEASLFQSTYRLVERSLPSFQSAELAAMAAKHLLQPDSRLMRSVLRDLGERRVVVLIDDLDRAEPSILPELFLGLRELLDIPGFAFVLAFDEKIVGAAIQNHRSAIGDGHEFLEKLLDFSFELPTPTKEQILNLARHEHQKYCAFADISALEGLADVLPPHPRKIKRLIRHIAALRTQIERHDDDEIRWRTIYLTQLIRLESEGALNRLVEYEEDIHKNFLVDLMEPTDETTQTKQELLNRIVSDSECVDTERKKRLETLVKKIAEGTSLTDTNQLRYSAQIWINPHAITWREFRRLFSDWSKNQDTYDIDFWVRKHAPTVNYKTQRVADELFEAALSHRNTCLERASSTPTATLQAEWADSAMDALNLTAKLYIEGLPCVGADYFRSSINFHRIFETSMKWANFDGQPSDVKLRNREKEVIQNCAEAGIQNSLSIIAKLSPWRSHHFHQDKYDGLMGLCMPRFERMFVTEFLARITKQDGMIFSYENFEKLALRHTIYRLESLLWKEPYRTELKDILRTAPLNPIVHENAYNFIRLLTAEFEDTDEAFSVFIEQNTNELSELWRSATAGILQFRFQGEFRILRKKLIDAGMEEADLPNPDWLQTVDEPRDYNG